jgi:hypothetical protein
MPEPQGLIYENITIINIGNTGTSGTLTYNTGSTIDCSAIISVIAYHNGSTIDKTNSTFYSLGNGLDNCALKIPIDLNVNEESFNMEIIMENYALWEVYRANDILGVMNTSNSEFCQQFNYTYEIPIESILNKTGMDLFCNRILDDEYWYDTLVRNEAVNVNTIGEFESIITELRFYYPEIVDAYFFVEAIKRSNNQVNTLNLTQEIYDLIINQSINVSFNETQNLINIQTANILSAISSSTNLSTMEYNLLNQTIYSQIATLSNQINSNTTQIQTLINSQVNIILNTIDYYHNLTTAEIQSLNATMTSQYNNVIANQNTIISITNQINATTLANQLAIQNILAQLNATNIQIQYLNSTMLQILNQTQTNENWLTQIWNYITSYLTNLTLNINQTTTINQNLLNQLLNQTNTTLYPVIIQYNETNCLSGGAWNIQAIVLNQNNQLMTPPYANCQITTDITGTNNMTFNYPYYTYNTICPSPQAWNWTITCV